MQICSLTKYLRLGASVSLQMESTLSKQMKCYIHGL